jgi:hypothetical protein
MDEGEFQYTTAQGGSTSYLDYFITKNVTVNQLQIENPIGFSDHLALKVTVDKYKSNLCLKRSCE